MVALWPEEAAHAEMQVAAHQMVNGSRLRPSHAALQSCSGSGAAHRRVGGPQMAAAGAKRPAGALEEPAGDLENVVQVGGLLQQRQARCKSPWGSCDCRRSCRRAPPPVIRLRSSSSCCPPCHRGNCSQVLPLGAGQEVGRSCIIIKYGGKTVMLDCGVHPGFFGLASLPFFDEVRALLAAAQSVILRYAICNPGFAAPGLHPAALECWRFNPC